MSAPQDVGSAAMVRLVAGRELSARLRDKNFIISSVFILVLLLGTLGLQVVLNSGSEETRVGLVGEAPGLEEALAAQGQALGVDVVVSRLDDEAAARTAIEDGEVDGVLVADGGQGPELLVEQSADGSLQAVVQGAVGQVAVAEQLAAAGVTGLDVPEVTVTALDPDADRDGQRVVVAIIGTGLLYGLLILFGQFVAQGVVEEKSSRVVELLLSSMKPWQLLAGKILGLGLLGLAQIVVIAVVGVAGALAFDLVDIPGELIGTAVSVVLWFVLAYALYASIFAVAASLVSRQEDLGTVIMPTTLVLVAGFIVGIQAAANPDGTLAVVTSFIPGLSPLVMPVRQAAGEVAAWEVGLAVVLAAVAVALVVRVGGRVYAASLLRTGGKTKLREALRAERV
ncbi:ABC transporter permease [Geodermatophilus sabuli]|uniref:ABC-2 type transport system permease protein n=1 Tax=Geodermatophilus sabuli TaxID=1564158 RepID=A0A285ECU0_9ACTN|nr:ABC transporter permease [Geodermatophilus sabuli]MBB3083317.1 ABC-2 type transport system permease protein [Geodermatophilus sabuli]SNX96962.1 ABC-2 type transport system permease protein [Geodermatophilus sabuli]